MKPRLFSTLRCLQHENPLVSWRFISTVYLMALKHWKGIATNWQHPTNAARPARTAQDQRCQESDCCIICKGWCREVYYCRFVAGSNSNRIPLKNDSQPCSRICTTRTSKWYPRYRYLWPLHTNASESFRGATIIPQSVKTPCSNHISLMNDRQPAPSALELWCKIHVNGISSWRGCSCCMAWPYGYEGITAALT